jgi:hypothetical protein
MFQKWIGMLHMLQWLYTYVPNVSDVCCKCFYLDVAKVDLDVAYTCMFSVYLFSVIGVSYVCCKCFIWMLHMFAMAFKCFLGVLQMFSDVYCKCFIWMLHMFAMAFMCFLGVLQVFQTYAASVSAVFERMLQVFHLGVAKVDPPIAATFCSCGWRPRGASSLMGRHRAGAEKPSVGVGCHVVGRAENRRRRLLLLRVGTVRR